MAKLEKSKSSTVKKQKAKKRKNPNPHEDEVANKSVILEDQDEEVKAEENTEQQVITKQSKKRKNKEKGVIKEKRSKNSLVDGDNETDEEATFPIDGDLQPTLEELRESEKPENKLAIVTGRQKKKQKHQEKKEVEKSLSVEKEKQRNEEYLNKWKNAHEEWKFEKLRQISIQQTMFDEDKLSSTVWAMALEYLAGSKGAAKEKVINMANGVIDEIDKQCEVKEAEEDKHELVTSAKYQRARDLLQIFD